MTMVVIMGLVMVVVVMVVVVEVVVVVVVMMVVVSVEVVVVVILMVGDDAIDSDVGVIMVVVAPLAGHVQVSDSLGTLCQMIYNRLVARRST